MNQNAQDAILNKIRQANSYLEELDIRKSSLEALIILLKHRGECHPQYHKLRDLETTIQGIDRQITSLKKIRQDLNNKLEQELP